MADDLGGMRILMFARTMAMGGTERVVLQLCRALKGKVGFLGVMSRGGELVAELGAMGVQHFEVPDITGKDPATFAGVSRELRCVVRENGVNLVHCHHRMAALYCRLALPKGVRVVATAHNVFRGGRVGTRFLYRGMPVAACGGRVHENLVGYYGLPEGLVTLIPNSVPAFGAPGEPIADVAACPEGVLRIGFVGRLGESCASVPRVRLQGTVLFSWDGGRTRRTSSLRWTCAPFPLCGKGCRLCCSRPSAWGRLSSPARVTGFWTSCATARTVCS